MSDQTLILALLPIILLQIALQIYALYDLWKNRGAYQNIWIWVIVILVMGLLGPLVYFILGRKGGEA